MLKKTNPLSCMTNFGKNEKQKIFADVFDLVAGSLINLYLFDSIFSGIVKIDKLHNFVDGIRLLNNGCYGNEKKTLFHLS